MRRAAAIVVLVLVGCEKPPEPTAIQRGEAVFRPVADKFAAEMIAELRKTEPAVFDRYLKEIGGKDESDLVRKVSTETLLHYAEALSMSSSKEAELRAGKFDDERNLRRIKAAIDTFTVSKLTVPHVCQALLQKYNAGRWKTGLELEFSARVLEGQTLLPKDKG